MSDRFVGVVRARWVVPIEGDPIPDGAVCVGPDGTLEAVGPAASIVRPAGDVGGEEGGGGEGGGGGTVLDLGAAVVLPGLVNVHAHPELTALRGALEDRSFADWVGELVRYKYLRMSAEETRASTVLGVAEALAAGVTTLAATDDAGFLAEVVGRAGLRGIVYREVFGPDPRDWREAFARAKARVAEVREHETDLVRIGVSPHAPYSVSEPLLRAVAEWVGSEGFLSCVHVAESEAEDRFVRDGAGPFAEAHRARGIPVEARGVSPVEWLDTCGLLARRPLLVHCVRLTGEDVGRIAQAQASVAHCPVSNARLGHGVAPVAELRAQGVRVGLGSDSVASNNRVDLLEEARVAGLLQRAMHCSPSVWPARELLRMATLGGAEALGFEARVGSLRPGKEADLIAVSLEGTHARPVHDPVVTLVHSSRASDVIWTVVRGRTLYRSGVFATLQPPGE